MDTNEKPKIVLNYYKTRTNIQMSRTQFGLPKHRNENILTISLAYNII